MRTKIGSANINALSCTRRDFLKRTGRGAVAAAVVSSAACFSSFAIRRL
ncbi:MAG: twin-arginine translocation signal domain-containing protein [Desulfobacteraceae bacterium]|nr:twin-arginine translocation signal domain-containing protein [Desulfobacteraceae bacterium]